MQWTSKVEPPPTPPQAAIQLVMVRGRHYYSYVADCSQSKQSRDELSDPHWAFSWDTKERKLQRHWGGTSGLHSDRLCKPPHQSLLVSFFLPSPFLFTTVTDKRLVCAYTNPAGLFYYFIADNSRKSHLIEFPLPTTPPAPWIRMAGAPQK